MKAQTPDAVLRPGPSEWELWRFPAKGAPVAVDPADHKGARRSSGLVLALPARDLLAVPLWISAQADPVELAGLELSSRHLLRRNTAVHTVPIATRDGSSLVLALASSDDSKAPALFPEARRFEASARLWDPGNADAVIWRELGELCFALFAAGKCVFFTATGETVAGPAFCGAITRTALRLKAEGVVAGTPAKVRVFGAFDAEELSSLAGTLRVEIEQIAALPPPVLPAALSNPAPPSATSAEERRTTRRRLAKLGLAAGLVYLAVVTALAGDLIFRRFTLGTLRATNEELHPQAVLAGRTLDEWREFRHTIDPATFALDQLAAVARGIPGEQVRLTQFALDRGRLLIAGEAADITQAYAFFDQIKASPDLQDYDWTPRQPQLAGKSKVRFEIEGVRPDAQIDEQ